MGTGIILPPTRLSIDGVTWDSGDVEIASGVGLSWARQSGPPKIYTPTGSVADWSMPPSLFIPGVLAAADPLLIFANLSKTGRSYLTAVEANLGTAPTGPSVANNLGIKVYGTAKNSPSLTLAMDGTGDNGGKHYSLDARVGTVAGSNDGNSSTGGGFSGAGQFTRVRVSAQVTVGGVALPLYGTTGPDGSGYAKLYELYDAAGNLLAQSARYYGPVDTPVVSNVPNYSYPVPFTSSVVLQANTDYFVGCRFPDDIWSSNGNVAPVITVPYVGTPAYSGNMIAPSAADFYQWTSTASVAPPFNPATYVHRTLGISPARLFGGPRQALIAGTIRVALVVAGLGPTTPGNDLNIRLGWQSAG